MKSKLIPALVITTIVLVSCGKTGKHDGKIVKDQNGNFYLLENTMGNVYALNPIDTSIFKMK